VPGRTPACRQAGSEGILIPIYNIKGEKVGEAGLDKAISDKGVSKVLLHQVTVLYQRNRRLGLASTKTRGEVSGSGVKPWRQKGTGRARIGSIRSPVWRGGGTTFGPRTRDYSVRIPKKIKKAAFISALNSRLSGEGLFLIDEIKLEEAKTKRFAALLEALGVGNRSILIVVKEMEPAIKRAAGNIPFVCLKPVSGLNAYDLLLYRKVVMTKEAFSSLEESLKKTTETRKNENTEK